MKMKLEKKMEFDDSILSDDEVDNIVNSENISEESYDRLADWAESISENIKRRK